MQTETVPYLRSGRTVRAFGTIVDRDRFGGVLIQPARSDWHSVWITEDELNAGAVKGERKTREKADPSAEKPKPVKLPRWQRMVSAIKELQDDFSAMKRVPVPQTLLTAITAELEKANTLFSNGTRKN